MFGLGKRVSRDFGHKSPGNWRRYWRRARKNDLFLGKHIHNTCPCQKSGNFPMTYHLFLFLP